MSDRDELAVILVNTQRARYGLPPRATTEHCSESCWAEADAILAAGWVKPRTITTVAELDALAVGSVVLSLAYHSDVNGMAIVFQRWYDGLWHRGARSGDTHPDNFLPATVLYEGQA